MNYIEQLNGFKIRRRINPISANSICLYLIIFEYANELNFLCGFTVANSTLKGMSNLSDYQFKNARNELKQKGYINYTNGSGNQAGKYTLIDLTSSYNPQVQLQSQPQTQLQPQQQTNRKPTTLYKLNKTKLNNKEKCKSFSFTPPTPEDVRAYCLERKNDVDPQRFVDFYQSKGWYIGKNKMKDWKSAVRTWERSKSQPKENKPGLQNEHKYDWEEIEKKLLGE